MNPSVYILIPVHNRRAITLTCLETLHRNGDLDHYQVVVIDDGSTDGTAEAVQASFPDVTILKGDGNLWWTGAIKKGMIYALQNNATEIIWLNDDSLPTFDTVSKLIASCKSHPNSIISAYLIHMETGKHIFSGISLDKKKPKEIQVGDSLKPYLLSRDILNGNLVCISTDIIRKIGLPDDRNFPHYHGDTDYTFRAKQSGYDLYIDTRIHAHSYDTVHNSPRLLFSMKSEQAIEVTRSRFFSKKSPQYLPSWLLTSFRLFGMFFLLKLIIFKLLPFFMSFVAIYLVPFSVRNTFVSFASKYQ